MSFQILKKKQAIVIIQRQQWHSCPQSCDPFGQRHGSSTLKTGSLQITGFWLSAQPQKFETITVTIGYKNGQLLRLCIILAPARGLDPWHWPKGSQLWGRECNNGRVVRAPAYMVI